MYSYKRIDGTVHSIKQNGLSFYACLRKEAKHFLMELLKITMTLEQGCQQKKTKLKRTVLYFGAYVLHFNGM
jgi:hypothetical protein